MLDEKENIYGFYSSNADITWIDPKPEIEFIRKKETDTVKAKKVELIDVDELRESRNQSGYTICKIEYDKQDYWFNACHYGSAIIELYLMLNRPKDFMQRLGTINQSQIIVLTL